MNRSLKKLVRQGDLVGEVEVELSDDPSGWEPYLSLDDARKLDQVRSALRQGDVATASRFGSIYQLTPIKATT